MKSPSRIVEYLLLCALLAAVFPLGMSLRTGHFDEPDTRENLLIAVNLLHSGVYSVSESTDGTAPPPTKKREPLYPTLLALCMAAFRGERSVAELPTLGDLHPGFIRKLKTINVLLHLGLIAASWWAARVFFGRPWPALAVAFTK